MNRQRQIAKHFDSLADAYDTFKTRNSHYYQTLISGIGSFITKPKPTILDIGCGTGTMLARFNPKRGLGIDISHEMIALARQKYSRKSYLTFKTHDIAKIKVSGNFDYIIFADVIEHIVNTSQVIKNLADSMQVKTTLIFAMANPTWEPILMLLEKMHLKMPEGPHHRISEAELFALFKKNKLHVSAKRVYLPALPFPFLKNLGLIYVYAIHKENFNR